ncbi:biotin-dependent carboxyltransferase family protein [Rhizobium sp. SL42]|uniref:5-oxoprolinase subunit C family protein n=1 Tax=Rhizobium sp. SL42 TaxID=2806346 RepID=UPI001F2C591F|nr:biotin-dependent carboxyltransferase family protein [Rhizobium sp. SL42]UJW74217.1 biotin-dependent carboxyltransferase family protein [Rhizobium sp. SL42]
MIDILQTGPLNTIQDLGRPGYRNIGVTASGAMDPLALSVGNLLVGNAESEAGIEIQTFPFRVRFTAKQVFALTGADCAARLDGQKLLGWWCTEAQPDQVLELDPPLKDARAYLSLAGGVGVEPVLGSRSTSLRGAFGGFDGRSLAVGDEIAVMTSEPHGFFPKGGFGVKPPTEALAQVFPPVEDGVLTIRAIPAGEHDLFGADAARFWSQAWKISARSDRTGFRLSGQPIRPIEAVEMRSHGIMPGVVQVPPAGEPIVQMSDANTAGGYPKIAGVLEADLWRLGQARIGSSLRFQSATHADARAAEIATKAYLDDISQTRALLLQALAAMA